MTQTNAGASVLLMLQVCLYSGMQEVGGATLHRRCVFTVLHLKVLRKVWDENNFKLYHSSVMHSGLLLHCR